MLKYIIKTNKGYIAERYDNKTYPPLKINNGVGFTKNFFNTLCNDTPDMLGFTDSKEKAIKYSACIGNRVQEIVDRVIDGYEPDIKYINIEIYNEQSGKIG